MSWTDRVVEYPNRVKLTPVSGETNVYDMTMEEGEIEEEGTLLNAQSLNDETNALIDAKLGGIITPANIKAGKYTFTGTHSAGSTYSKTITFSQPFTKAPVVVATPQNPYPANISVAVGNITATGFTLYVYTAVNRTLSHTISWIAMAM